MKTILHKDVKFGKFLIKQVPITLEDDNEYLEQETLYHIADIISVLETMESTSFHYQEYIDILNSIEKEDIT